MHVTLCSKHAMWTCYTVFEIHTAYMSCKGHTRDIDYRWLGSLYSRWSVLWWQGLFASRGCGNSHMKLILTHWYRDKITGILQTTFSDEFSWMKMYQFRWRFHPVLFPINNIPLLAQIMAWRRSGDKPLSEPMMFNLLAHICVTRPQWVSIQGLWQYPYETHLKLKSLKSPLLLTYFSVAHSMMTSSNENSFRVTSPLCGEFTGHRWIPLTKANDAELWCFLWSVPE